MTTKTGRYYWGHFWSAGMRFDRMVGFMRYLTAAAAVPTPAHTFQEECISRLRSTTLIHLAA